jgi:GTP-binding protein
MDFVDECRVFVHAGDGGRGCVSFRREKYVPRGGPNGGSGGRGGSVVLIGDRGKSTLLDARYRRHLLAERGAHGQGARKDGRSGSDLEIAVPLGTIVIDEQSGTRIGEVLEHGQRLVVARGGVGGRGNACFATPTRRAPIHAEPGTPGEQRWLRLELRVMADVGLLGFPNSGKSTLISAVSAAKPRVASYPFTTLAPHLGMVGHDDARFVMADLPGVIPGAHAGAGLGHRFLRHLDRTRLLVHLVDPEPLLRREPGRALLDDYRALRRELSLHAADLALRPEIVCISKADLVAPSERPALDAPLRREVPELGWISAASGEGVRDLVARLARELSG